MKNLDLSGKTVLVIEDRLEWRSRLTDLCLDMNLIPITAENEKEARAAFKDDSFDLVLLDLALSPGGLEGVDLLRLLRGNAQLKSIPVIVITNYSQTEHIVECLKIGADDFIEKEHPEAVIEARMRNSLIRSMQRKHIEDILHTILPRPISDMVIEGVEVEPVYRPDVAVLFTDIKGFTISCIDRPPADVFQQLRAMFTRFEKLAGDAGVEKIKTIGDAFMGTAGLLDDVPDAVLRCVRFGENAIQAAKDIGLVIRVGINVGPVMAGFLGEERLQYDLLGHTVNMAQRVEGAARPSCICLTEPAYQKIAKEYPGKTPRLAVLKGMSDEVPVVDLIVTDIDTVED